MYSIPMVSVVFDLIGSDDESAKQREEYIVLRELSLNVGRVCGVLLFICVISWSKEPLVINVLLLVIGSSTFFSWCIHQKSVARIETLTGTRLPDENMSSMIVRKRRGSDAEENGKQHHRAYRRYPCRAINRLLEPEAAELYVKLEYFNPSGSVKDRAAWNLIDQAEKVRLSSAWSDDYRTYKRKYGHRACHERGGQRV